MIKPVSRRPAVRLTVSASRAERTSDLEAVSIMPWPVAAIGGSLAAVALGWLTVGIVVAAAWLTATRTPLVAMLDTIGQGWLAMHGARVHLGDVTVALPPLGATALVTTGVAVATHWAGLQIDAAGRRRTTLAGLVAASAASYAVGTLVLASLVGTPSQATAAFGGALVIGLVGASVGGLRTLGGDLGVALPAWLGPAGRSALVGLATLAAGSSLAILVGLAQRWEQVLALQHALAPDAVGSVLLVAIYLAWLPTMLAWASAYVLGAGLTLGTGTLVVPGSSTLGLLPALPPLAAVPTNGTPFDAGWVLVGVASGVSIGWWFSRQAARAGQGPRWLSWSWQAALAGLGVALAWLALAWLSRGDLGTERLVGMGPVFPAMVWALSPVVVAASATAAVAAIVARRHVGGGPSGDDRAAEASVAETALVGGSASEPDVGGFEGSSLDR